MPDERTALNDARSPLTEPIVALDTIRVVKSGRRRCRCAVPSGYLVDDEVRIVYCNACGGECDAFDALRRIAQDRERFRADVVRLQEQCRQLEAWRPHRRVLRELDNAYGGQKHLLPTCPHCGRGIFLEELTRQWTSRAGEVARRQREGQEVP
jgi:hypothetical protein